VRTPKFSKVKVTAKQIVRKDNASDHPRAAMAWAKTVIIEAPARNCASGVARPAIQIIAKKSAEKLTARLTRVK
jgi:hypothetical protein